MLTKQIAGLVQYFSFDAAMAILVGLVWEAQIAFMFLAALYAARIGLTMYNVVRQLFVYFVFGGKRVLKRNFMNILSAGSFPKEREIWYGGSEYIADVRQNKKLPVSVRCAAAEVGGYLDAFRFIAPVSFMLQQFALSQAVDDYAAVSPVGQDDDPEIEGDDFGSTNG